MKPQTLSQRPSTTEANTKKESHFPRCHTIFKSIKYLIHKIYREARDSSIKLSENYTKSIIASRCPARALHFSRFQSHTIAAYMHVSLHATACSEMCCPYCRAAVDAIAFTTHLTSTWVQNIAMTSSWRPTQQQMDTFRKIHWCRPICLFSRVQSCDLWIHVQRNACHRYTAIAYCVCTWLRRDGFHNKYTSEIYARKNI